MAFTEVLHTGLDAGHVGVMTSGGLVGTGFTMLNFIGAGNTFSVNGTTLDISIAGSGTSGDKVIRENFVVTSNTQSIFTLANDFNEGLIDVYVNGLKLAEGDFTEDPQTNRITLVIAAVKGDSVEFVAWAQKLVSTTISSQVDQLKVTGVTTITTLNVTNAFLGENNLIGSDWILEVPNRKVVGTSTTVTATSSDHVLYTKYQEVELSNNVTFEIANGSSFVLDAYQFS